VASRRTPEMVIAARGLVRVARTPPITMTVACTRPAGKPPYDHPTSFSGLRMTQMRSIRPWAIATEATASACPASSRPTSPARPFTVVI
jgi:hypothetical protein